ncbi:hypothetical protein IFR05_017344, partial [Cadophora sp. M221]
YELAGGRRGVQLRARVEVELEQLDLKPVEEKDLWAKHPAPDSYAPSSKASHDMVATTMEFIPWNDDGIFTTAVAGGMPGWRNWA